MAAQSRDNTVMLPFDLWRELFINDADFQLARVSYAQLSPVPFQQLIEPLDLKTFYALQTPRSFLIGTDDTALPPGEWGWHPRLSSRLGVYRSSKCRAAMSSCSLIRSGWPTKSLKPPAISASRGTSSICQPALRRRICHQDAGRVTRHPLAWLDHAC